MRLPLPRTAIFPGRYLQAPDATDLLPDLAAGLGGKTMAFAGGTAMREIIPRLERGFARTGAAFQAEQANAECTDHEIDRLASRVRDAGCEVVMAIGGGKALDTGKAVAYAAGTRVIIVPTIASTDAPCSAVAVVYTEEGMFKRYISLPRNPDLVVVDTAVIARAPVRFLIAGMGDALSTWIEADACRQACAPNLAGGVSTLAAYALARLCYDTILEFGVAACVACREKIVTPAFERVVEANTLLSGLGFESAGLSSAHSVHNGLTVLPETHAYYHGEKVAFGSLTALFLADRSRALIDEVYAFCESAGLPTTLSQLGVSSPTDDELRKVASVACVEGETIYNEPSAITPERVFHCLRMADAYGRERLRSISKSV
ncbi:MAG: glycerol dehydrogenase [Terrimicrobiaceae bacterium]|nr:glycerol dehydrogenase [Terrimicrobiaceae bacterium]